MGTASHAPAAPIRTPPPQPPTIRRCHTRGHRSNAATNTHLCRGHRRHRVAVDRHQTVTDLHGTRDASAAVIIVAPHTVVDVRHDHQRVASWQTQLAVTRLCSSRTTPHTRSHTIPHVHAQPHRHTHRGCATACAVSRGRLCTLTHLANVVTDRVEHEAVLQHGAAKREEHPARWVVVGHCRGGGKLQ